MGELFLTVFTIGCAWESAKVCARLCRAACAVCIDKVCK